MSIPSYTLGYPPDGSTLGQTKSTIRNNLDGTFKTVQINHYDNNDPTNPGKHKFIQLPVALGGPSTGATELLFYNGVSGTGIGGANNLFFQSYGGSASVQMTRHEVPSSTANGYSWLPGGSGHGLLIQWGTRAIGTQGNLTIVTFPIAFTAPSSVFSITLGCINSNNSPAANNAFIKAGTVTASQFTVTNSSNSGDLSSIYWMAIGY